MGEIPLNILDFLNQWRQFLIPLAVFGVAMVAALIARRILFRALDRWAQRTKTDYDDVIVEAVRAPFMVWALILAVYLAMISSPLPPNITIVGGKVLLVLWILSLTLGASKLTGAMVKRYSESEGSPVQGTTLTQNLVRIFVASIGILILLNSLGISITPILTALGVGGLAVALALQDTLSNLFAGFYVSLAKQVRIGDYIKLESGEEGYVTDIGWRAVLIRALPNNMIIVPNSKLAQSILTNYHMPEKRMSLLIPIGVSYDCDPVHIERILVEEALEGAKHIPGLLAEPAPFVRFIPGFGDSSLNFTLICQVQEFVDQFFAQSEMRKRIWYRFRQEGVEIPFPIRTLYYRGRSDVPAPEPEAKQQLEKLGKNGK